MGFEHLITSLGQLSSFDHSRCDAILQARQIEVINAYNPGKSGFERYSVYFGFYWAAGPLFFQRSFSFGLECFTCNSKPWPSRPILVNAYCGHHQNANATLLSVAMMLIGGVVIACAIVLLFR